MPQETILITGASGFIGRHAVAAFSDSDYIVKAMVRNPGNAWGIEGNDIDVVIADVTDPTSLQPALSGVDTVIHLAGSRAHSAKSKETFEVNVKGTANLLKAAVETGVSRVVFVSSLAIYGSASSGTIFEQSPQTGSDDYALSKIQAEQIVYQYADQGKIEGTVLRPGQVYGPGGRGWRTGFLKRPIMVDRGSGILNPVYVSNFIDALKLAIEAPAQDVSGQAFNIADIAVNWNTFMGYYEKMTGRKSIRIPEEVFRNMLSAMDFLVKHKVNIYSPERLRFILGTAELNTDKARTVLGWEPQVSLDHGMRKTEEWFRSTPKYQKYLV